MNGARGMSKKRRTREHSMINFRHVDEATALKSEEFYEAGRAKLQCRPGAVHLHGSQQRCTLVVACERNIRDTSSRDVDQEILCLCLHFKVQARKAFSNPSFLESNQRIESAFLCGSEHASSRKKVKPASERKFILNDDDRVLVMIRATSHQASRLTTLAIPQAIALDASLCIAAEIVYDVVIFFKNNFFQRCAPKLSAVFTHGEVFVEYHGARLPIPNLLSIQKQMQRHEYQEQQEHLTHILNDLEAEILKNEQAIVEERERKEKKAQKRRDKMKEGNSLLQHDPLKTDLNAASTVVEPRIQAESMLQEANTLVEEALSSTAKSNLDACLNESFPLEVPSIHVSSTRIHETEIQEDLRTDSDYQVIRSPECSPHSKNDNDNSFPLLSCEIAGDEELGLVVESEVSQTEEEWMDQDMISEHPSRVGSPIVSPFGKMQIVQCNQIPELSCESDNENDSKSLYD